VRTSSWQAEDAGVRPRCSSQLPGFSPAYRRPDEIGWAVADCPRKIFHSALQQPAVAAQNRVPPAGFLHRNRFRCASSGSISGPDGSITTVWKRLQDGDRQM